MTRVESSETPSVARLTYFTQKTESGNNFMFYEDWKLELFRTINILYYTSPNSCVPGTSTYPWHLKQKKINYFLLRNILKLDFKDIEKIFLHTYIS